MSKRVVKKIVKPFVPIADRVFSNKKIKNISLKVVDKFQGRYARFGEELETVVPRTYAGPWEFMLDTPKLAKSAKRDVYVSGWLVPDTYGADIKMRISGPDSKITELKYGIDRSDVATIIRAKKRIKVSNKCGFGSNVHIVEDGKYYLEISIDGEEWRKVMSIDLEYDLDLLAKDVYNPNLAHNMAEHLTLIDTKKHYFYEKGIDHSFELTNNDPKLIAFYLPQFHPFKENDEWWGKGFTEWTNVTAATPRFVGHEQPKLPADFGFYDLRYDENIKEQIDLAKNHGLHGFCFYYYWFSGRRLLETPLDSFLRHKDWDFNFMICWANENWTKRWDGRDQDVLVAQMHNEDDDLAFIKDVEHILLDSRYIRIDNKPVLMVYRAHDLDDTEKYVDTWRKYFRDKHNLELHLVAVRGFNADSPTEYGFDRGLDFSPLTFTAMLDKAIPSYNISHKMIDIKFTGISYDYRKVALELADTIPDKKDPSNYTSIIPAWDNDARKKGAGGVFHNSNPDIYGHWLESLINPEAREKGTTTDGLLFINAWNEWAEGAILEPDRMYGHAYLNRTSQILAKYSTNKKNKENFPLYKIKRTDGVKMAVVIHLFYADMWELFKNKLDAINPDTYDLFVTIPAKNEYIKDEIIKYKKSANIIITPNRGRDVLPFIFLANRLKNLGYEYVLKIHTKKSKHRKDGDLWMQDMLDKLIPQSAQGFKDLQEVINNSDTGVVGPTGHYVSLASYFGSNEDNIKTILDDTLGHSATNKVIKNVTNYGFFAGTMFWLRLDAIEPILNQYYQASDFDSESGQTDGTFAHAIERALTLVPYINGKKLYFIGDGKIEIAKLEVAENFEDYQFAKN